MFEKKFGNFERLKSSGALQIELLIIECNYCLCTTEDSFEVVA